MNPQPTLIEEASKRLGVWMSMDMPRPTDSDHRAQLKRDIEILCAQAAEIERLNARNVEVSVLAHAWMVAHDMRAAGMPVTYPARADVPALTARVEALEAVCKLAEQSLHRAYCATRSMEDADAFENARDRIRATLNPLPKPVEGGN